MTLDYSIKSRYNMPHTNTLLSFLQQIIDIEHALLPLRQRIQYQQHLLEQIFMKVAENDQVITIKNMLKYLEKKMAVNQREVYQIFWKFDRRRMGMIGEDDVRKQFQGRGKDGNLEKKKGTQQKKKKKTTKSNVQRVGRGSFAEVQTLFITYLSVLVKSVRILDAWRVQLIHTTPYIYFQTLNTSKTGTITPSQLLTFFHLHNHPITPSDSYLLHKALRCHNSQLNLQVFTENLHPLEFGYYPAFKYHLQLQHKIEISQVQKMKREAEEKMVLFLEERKNMERKRVKEQQAVLMRQYQLQQRVQKQIKVYQQLKHQILLKYHPQLTLKKIQKLQKQNNLNHLNQQIEQIEQESQRTHVYHQKIKNIQTLGQVQKYQNNKNSLPYECQHFYTQISQRKKYSKEELEKKIRMHAFQMRESQAFFRKKQVEKEILGPRTLR